MDGLTALNETEAPMAAGASSDGDDALDQRSGTVDDEFLARALAGRVGLVAVGFGFLAGVGAAVTFAVMKALSWLVWEAPGVGDRWWYVVCAVVLGGILIALVRPFSDDMNLRAQIAAAEELTNVRRRKVALLGLSAVIAVGFGGAIGPEAGLVAVVTELAALVSARISRSAAEARLLGRSGVAGALAGLYVSPPGASAYDDDTLGPTKLAVLVSSLAGLGGFLWVVTVLHMPHHPLPMPAYESERWGVDALLAVVPAVLATGVVAALSPLHRLLERALRAVGGVRVQTIVGSLAFASLAGAWPLLLFSGHDSFDLVPVWTAAASWGLLAGLALLKPLAMVLCLSSGWRGGEFFPLMLTGACIGALTTAFLPISLAAAMVAGMAAATAMGLRKPVAAILIVAFLAGGTALIAMLVGGAVAALALIPKAASPTQPPPDEPTADS